MLERGQISFVVLWVLNPIMILFFQNCSFAPSTETHGPTTPVVSSTAAIMDERTPAMASEDVPTPACRLRSNSDFCVE